ncbi:glycoside hydrolase [Thelephora ganbajun]|uniref:Glycoside hydrolase n=1 Tax=Thelephora ganbajun TaxID=370292 RepID=A0ACB6ZNG9_THEGA|nr:glycoside hydrolase [Thelephora ganbajun]
MRGPLIAVVLLTFVLPVTPQSIWDVWQTTWNGDRLFANVSPSTPITFTTSSTAASVDVQIDDNVYFQIMVGHGASLTDSSAKLFDQLKSQDSRNYWALIKQLFDPTDGRDSAGLSYLRVPLGASDFSDNLYTFASPTNDDLASFNVNNAPAYLFSTINDIQSVNPGIKVHLLPWSPPSWMKTSNSMNGGEFIDSFTNIYAVYLLKALQGFGDKGITAYAVGIQNEPENSDSTYPTCKFSSTQEANVGRVLRSLMDSNGFGSTKIIAYEQNWDNSGQHPIQVLQQATPQFAGASFHCYAGNVDQQSGFQSAFPWKEVYLTECTGVFNTDWWSSIKWWMDNLYIGSVNNGAKAVLMWNIALDGNGRPLLPGTNSCQNPPCRGVVTINGGNYTLNEEYYTMAQASRAITPRDPGGPWGQRIGVSVVGGDAWAPRVTAFVTKRNNPLDWWRYSIVVLNWRDNANGTWDPQDVTASITFRGQQASFTFPVGVTTLWWYAAPK